MVVWQLIQGGEILNVGEKTILDGVEYLNLS